MSGNACTCGAMLVDLAEYEPVAVDKADNSGTPPALPARKRACPMCSPLVLVDVVRQLFARQTPR